MQLHLVLLIAGCDISVECDISVVIHLYVKNLKKKNETISKSLRNPLLQIKYFSIIVFPNYASTNCHSIPLLIKGN